jgi:hypothetical protein
MSNTITGTVSKIVREGHTVYGNPIMRVSIRQVNAESPAWFRISDNASLVYAIENPEYRDQPHTFALTRAGRISHEVR